MYQHQHTPLSLEELESVPQPLVVLLEALLEKDPTRRFQDPGELLMAIPTPDCPLQEVIFLVERRISLSWIVPGQARMPTSLPSLHGPGWEVDAC
jgi:hypothetical protein